MKKRLISLDFLRGIAILMVVGFHAIEQALPEDFWDKFLNSAPKWQFYVLGPFLLLMSWRGFFLLISSIVYIYSFEAKYRYSKSPIKILKKYILTGIFLFFFGFIINIFLDPKGAIEHFIITGEWQPGQFVYRLKNSNAIQMIGLSLIIYAIIHYFIARNKGYLKVKRNITIYSLLMIIVIILTPILNYYLFSFYGITREEILYTETNSFTQLLLFIVYANLVGIYEPLFPFLFVIFIGCIKGIIISQDQEHWTDKKKQNRLYLMGIILIFIGIFDWIVITQCEPIQTYLISPMWFLILNSGIQVIFITGTLQFMDYRKKNKEEILKINSTTRFIRRAGLLSLTLFSSQFFDIIPRYLLTKLTGTDFIHLGALSNFGQAFILLGSVIIFWIIILRFWEYGRFYGSIDFIYHIVVSWITKQPIRWQDPINIRRNLYGYGYNSPNSITHFKIP